MTKLSHRAWGFDTLPSGDWLDAAACGPGTAELFDIVHGHSRPSTFINLKPNNEKALRICAACPVIRQCLDDALAHPNDHLFVAGGKVVHRGQIIPARLARKWVA